MLILLVSHCTLINKRSINLPDPRPQLWQGHVTNPGRLASHWAVPLITSYAWSSGSTPLQHLTCLPSPTRTYAKKIVTSVLSASRERLRGQEIEIKEYSFLSKISQSHAPLAKSSLMIRSNEHLLKLYIRTCLEF